MSTGALRLDAPIQSVSRPVLRLFREYAPPHRHVVTVSLLASLVYPILSLAPVYLLQTAIDGVLLGEGPVTVPGLPTTWIPTSPALQLWVLASGMVLTALLAAGLSVVATLGWGKFAQEVQHALRVDAFAAVQRRGLSFVETQQTGQLMSVLNDDVEECNRLLERFLKDLIETAVRVGGIVAVLFMLHWQLAMVALAAVPPMILLSRWFVGRIRPLYASLRQRVGILNARLENVLNGFHVVKAADGDAFERRRVRARSGDVYDAQWRVIRAQAAFFPSISAINWIAFGALVVIGGYWYHAGPPGLFTKDVTLGVLVAFLLYNQQLSTPLTQATHVLDVYYEARAAVARIFVLFDDDGTDEPPDSNELGDDRLAPIEIDDLEYTYPDSNSPAIASMSVRIAPGETVGIVGPTGSGKTTFLRLLLGFLDPDAGEIRVGGRPLQERDHRTYRRRIGYVSQTAYLFTGTVRDNVIYPDRDLSETTIKAALETAKAWEFVAALPEGLKTTVGQDGATLSGGQRQRLTLARELAGQPQLLLLDEATNNLDMATEADVLTALADSDDRRTTVMVAHRLSSVRHADTIIVLDGGRVVQQGSHQELLEQPGPYATLWGKTADRPLESKA